MKSTNLKLQIVTLAFNLFAFAACTGVSMQGPTNSNATLASKSPEGTSTTEGTSTPQGSPADQANQNRSAPPSNQNVVTPVGNGVVTPPASDEVVNDLDQTVEAPVSHEPALTWISPDHFGGDPYDAGPGGGPGAILWQARGFPSNAMACTFLVLNQQRYTWPGDGNCTRVSDAPGYHLGFNRRALPEGTYRMEVVIMTEGGAILDHIYSPGSITMKLINREITQASLDTGSVTFGTPRPYLSGSSLRPSVKIEILGGAPNYKSVEMSPLIQVSGGRWSYTPTVDLSGGYLLAIHDGDKVLEIGHLSVYSGVDPTPDAVTVTQAAIASDYLGSEGVFQASAGRGCVGETYYMEFGDGSAHDFSTSAGTCNPLIIYFHPYKTQGNYNVKLVPASLCMPGAACSPLTPFVQSVYTQK